MLPGALHRILACALASLLAGCAAMVPLDVRIAHVDLAAGYRLEVGLDRVAQRDPETLMLVAFSGGGTRAAAFSYGVLEEMRRTEVRIDGRPARMLDQIDAISSVSGGTFTALAYALYGERLFDVFEPRFLKRDVQGNLIRGMINPLNWPSLLWGSESRSDLAAAYYDEILFDGATFADLVARPGPLVIASSTDFSTGSRFPFLQGTFDLICADLSKLRLAQAATASSAVPVAFAPVTVRNWGGTCGVALPAWLEGVAAGIGEGGNADTLSLRLRVQSMEQLQDGAARPWLHLVDGGISDNLGLRAFIDMLQAIKLRDQLRQQLGLAQVRRIALVVVNSLSASPPSWGISASGPNLFETILQAASVPIDRNSMDAIVMMQSMIERWKLRAEVRSLEARLDEAPEPPPPIEFYPIVLDFDAIADPAERAFFNTLPTTLSLPPETIDRLREIGGRLLRESPEFRRLQRSLAAAALRSAAASPSAAAPPPSSGAPASAGTPGGAPAP